MSKTRGSAPVVERSVYFFRIDTGISAAGKPNKLDLSNAVEQISKMPFAADSKRYWTLPSGDALALWTPSAGKFDRFNLAAVRRSSLPQSELNGKLSDLRLADGAGLHEPSHIKILPDNILGVEFNFYGPRVSRLPGYLRHAVPTLSDFALEALLRKDVEAQLKNHSEIRTLDLYIRPSYVDSVTAASKGLGAAFDSIRAVSRAGVIGLTLRPEPYKRDALPSKVLKAVKKLAKRNDLNENVSTFKVRGFNQVEDRTEVLDLLQDQLVTKKQIVTLGTRSRAIDSSAAFDAIDQAYDELKDEIRVSAGLGVIDGGS